MCTNEVKISPVDSKLTVKKNARRVCLASWIDLLGYGKQIGEANFDPNNEKAFEPHKRLRNFHKLVEKHAKRDKFPTLVLNDGVVAFRDLLSDDASDTYDFFYRSWKLYSEVKKCDKIGARMVLASGFRNLGSDSGIKNTKEELIKILEKYKACDIKLNKATKQVGPFRPPFAILPQLQENFAFSKAYTAERSGKKGKLPGPNFYVDLNIFRCTKKFEPFICPYVEWSCKRLKLEITFAKFPEIENSEFEKIQEADMNGKSRIERRLFECEAHGCV